MSAVAPRAWWPWIALALTLVGVAAIRARLVDVPLDRDEGEYAYVADLLLHGVPPYERAYNMKLPGIYAAYAGIIAVFGRSAAGVHRGLIVVNALSITMMFLLARRLLDARAAVTAAATLGVLSVTPVLLGPAGYAEHFVVAAALAGLVLLDAGLDGTRRSLLLGSGVCLGVAITMKQSGAAFAAFAIVHASWTLLSRRDEPRRTAVFAVLVLVAGVLVPLAIVSAVLLVAGTFDAFVFWTYRYAWQYASTTTPGMGLDNLGQRLDAIIPKTAVIAISAAFGALALARDRSLCRDRGGVFLLAVCSFAGAAIGLYFRPQYFIVLAPAVALLAAVTPTAARRALAPHAAAVASFVAVVLAVAPLAHALHADRALLFSLPPAQVARTIYGANPFSESVEIGRYIREHAARDSRIAVIGSEPEIYFYAGRPGATGYIYMYPLVEPQPYARLMQAEMIGEVERARPEFVVFVNVSESWLLRPDSDRTVLGWFAEYRRAFDRVGMIEIFSPAMTRYDWTVGADRAPEAAVWLEVFRRRTPAATAMHDSVAEELP